MVPDSSMEQDQPANAIEASEMVVAFMLIVLS